MKDIEIPRLQVKPTQGRRQKFEAGSFVPIRAKGKFVYRNC